MDTPKTQEILTKKDIYRQRVNNIILTLVIGLACSVVILTFLGKLTPEFNMALSTLLLYAGNHTYQNFRTKPKPIIKEEG